MAYNVSFTDPSEARHTPKRWKIAHWESALLSVSVRKSINLAHSFIYLTAKVYKYLINFSAIFITGTIVYDFLFTSPDKETYQNGVS